MNQPAIIYSRTTLTPCTYLELENYIRNQKQRKRMAEAVNRRES